MQLSANTSIGHFEAYLNALTKVVTSGQHTTYNWQPLPSQLHVVWMPYAWMLDEFARELANNINAFTSFVDRLSAWATVVSSMDDQQKMEATFEFINLLATNALLFLYAIKSRFSFAAAQLSHQANKVWDAKWTDDLPMDGAIYLNTTDKYAAHWNSYNRFKQAVEKISGSEFKVGTRDFRNAFNHRFSPTFVIGMTGFVTRTKDSHSGQVSYGLGERGPLELTALIPFLERERNYC